MNTAEQIECGCNPCSGQGCACGCQSAVTHAACTCGPDCGCEGDCSPADVS